MRGMDQLTGVLGGKKVARVPQSNAADALRTSKAFLSVLANADFFSGPPSRGLTRALSAQLEVEFEAFGSKNPIMSTPTGALCLPHIEGFIDSFFVAQSKLGVPATSFDALIKIKAYQGANHA